MVEVLEKILASGGCYDIKCQECPFNTTTHECDLTEEMGNGNTDKFTKEELIFVAGVKWALKNLK